MNPSPGGAVRPPNKRLWLILVAALAAGGMGAECEGPPPPPPPTVVPPTLTLTVNGIPDDMNDLLVVPTTGFVVNVRWQAGTYPVDLDIYPFVRAERWGSGYESGVISELALTASNDGRVGVFTGQLTPGTWTIWAYTADTEGNLAQASLAVAVRSFGGPAPIATGQKIWLDFESDRDATPGPDFPVDLQAFGLGNPAAPVESGWVLAQVTQTVVDRVYEAYKLQPANGLDPDPVKIAISSTQPSSGDITQICIGGEDPSGGITIGSILTDYKNSNRTSVECNTLPPTGIFPRELLILSGEPAFQAIFNPLIPWVGGTPVGAHPADPIVLDPGFDPGSGTPEQLARYEQVQAAIQAFGDALGSIVAHETGHALGLVPPGPPGGGLFGGSVGAQLNHSVLPGGGDPAENFLMNAGYTYTFAKLAGLNGNPLPHFRPIDYAYLRDRVVIDPLVTLLAFSPVVSSVDPSVITPTGWTQLFVNGTGFLPTPVIRLINPGYTYNVAGELLISSEQVRGGVHAGQIPPGVYDVELKNPDGQISVLPASLTVPTP
jgi:hypothetical protein